MNALLFRSGRGVWILSLCVTFMVASCAAVGVYGQTSGAWTTRALPTHYGSRSVNYSYYLYVNGGVDWYAAIPVCPNYTGIAIIRCPEQNDLAVALTVPIVNISSGNTAWIGGYNPQWALPAGGGLRPDTPPLGLYTWVTTGEVISTEYMTPVVAPFGYMAWSSGGVNDSYANPNDYAGEQWTMHQWWLFSPTTLGVLVDKAYIG